MHQDEQKKLNMAEELSWPSRLNHVRFSALLVFMEKFVLLTSVALFLSIKAPLWAWISVIVVGFFFLLHSHANHFALLEGAGLPTARLRI